MHNENMYMLKSGGLFINNNVYNPQRPLKHYLEYTALLCMGAVFCENPRSILVIGLAGGTVPLYLQHHYPEAAITCVDFDDAMLEVAQRFFGFRQTPKMRVVIDDGRVFLNRSDALYDLIVLDAFDGRNVPFHMCSREFLELIRSRLAQGGVLAANTPGSPRVTPRYLATYLSVFPYMEVFQAKHAGNRILIAHKDGTPRSVPQLARLFAEKQQSIGYAELNMEQLFSSTYALTATVAPNVPVFTDDFAPVNLLLPPVHLSL